MTPIPAQRRESRKRQMSCCTSRPSRVEPVSGFEPLTCRLQEVRPGAPRALAAQIGRTMTLLPLAELELSGAPFHEPFHAKSARATRRRRPRAGQIGHAAADRGRSHTTAAISAPWSSPPPTDLCITSVSRALVAGFKARVSFRFTGCCWWRPLAAAGGSGHFGARPGCVVQAPAVILARRRSTPSD